MDVRVKTFVREAADRLGFLQTEFGFTAPQVVPDETGVYLQVRRVRFERADLAVEVSLELSFGGEEYVTAVLVTADESGSRRRTEIEQRTRWSVGIIRHAGKGQSPPRRCLMGMADIPMLDKTITGRISAGLSWLDRQIEKIVNPTAPPPPAPVDMTDEQLHSAIYNIGAVLLNGLGKVIQDSFARHGYDMNNRRFRHPITITVPGHVLTMSTDANDAYGLVITALNRHAHAAALGPIRFILESLAWLRWLLEDPDDKVRAARAYRLTMDAVENFRSVGKTVNRVTSGAAEAKELDSRLTAASDQMKRELLALADEDGVTIPPSPGSVSKLAEQYLSGHGGYLTYAILNVSGAHAGPVHGYMFYGYPETGFADYDFKHMFDRRAHWTAVAIRLYLDVCDLAAPVLGWPNWDATANAARRQLQPLADEAERRYEAPMRRALARIT